MNNLILESTSSTNKDAYRLALEGAVNGSAVIAKMQTAGRGRLGKSWLSVTGKGLYCSIILRPKLDLLDFSKVTLVVGLAVSDVLGEMYDIPIGLKWPNDLYVDDKKLGGILVESSPLNCGESEHFVIVGVGVNINHSKYNFPEEIRDNSTSLKLESKKDFDCFEIFKVIQKKILLKVQEVEKNGFKEVLIDWKKKDILLGRSVEMVNVKEEVVRGVALGIDNEGVLQVRDANGNLHKILSGDIRLAQNKAPQ